MPSNSWVSRPSSAPISSAVWAARTATECAIIAGGMRQVTGEGAGLVASEVGQRRSRRPGVEPSVDVAVRLSVSDQYQPATHGLPSRSCVSQRDASSSRGGAAPVAEPVGHEPK